MKIPASLANLWLAESQRRKDMPKPKKPKRRINWELTAGVIQILVGLIEIGIIVAQCITSREEDEEEQNQ
jgi:hypothetical protein